MHPLPWGPGQGEFSETSELGVEARVEAKVELQGAGAGLSYTPLASSPPPLHLRDGRLPRSWGCPATGMARTWTEAWGTAGWAMGGAGGDGSGTGGLVDRFSILGT